MTEKEIVLETIRSLTDDCSLEEIAERIEFMAVVQKVSINSTEVKVFSRRSQTTISLCLTS